MKNLLIVLLTICCFSFNTNAQCSVEIIESGGTLCASNIMGSGNPFISWSTGETSNCITPNTTGNYCVTASFQDSCFAQACYQFQDTLNFCNIEIEQVGNQLCVTNVQGSGNPFISWSTGETSDCITPNSTGNYCVTAWFQDSCQVEACIEMVLAGINDEVKVNSILVSPNPFHDYIDINGDFNESKTVIQLIDVSGALKYDQTHTISKEGLQLYLPNLVPGIYFILIKNDNLQVSKRVVRL